MGKKEKRKTAEELDRENALHKMDYRSKVRLLQLLFSRLSVTLVFLGSGVYIVRSILGLSM